MTARSENGTPPFHGPQHKGAARDRRKARRLDAEERNFRSPCEHRAAYRRQLDQLTGLDENPQPARKRRKRKPKAASDG